ncbi:sensor histidine kinase [Nonomuraea sp. NPDC050790]|uniref:sensor histidine kinase n=1 Tax=Nonomuraea sp. NPDC050790 TaxID=3364371 RepID=UPI0037A805E0
MNLARLPALARWSSPAADGLLAAVIFVVTFGPGQVAARGELLPLQVALVAPLVWRRRAPVVVFFAIAVAAAVQWVLGVQLPADVSLLVALYTVAARSTSRWTWAAGATLEAGALLAAARWAPPGSFPVTAAALTALVAAALTTGLWTRDRRAYVRTLEEDRERRARLAVAEERARMTRELHDIVTHNLSVMVALADSAAYVRERAPGRAAQAVDQIAETGRQALADMRRTLGDAPEPLHPAPGIAQLDDLAATMRTAGLPTRVEVTGDPATIPAAAQLTLYRITQEALTNALRHAPGTTALVRISLAPDRAMAEITNNAPTGRPPGTSRLPGIAGGTRRPPGAEGRPLGAAGGVAAARDRRLGAGGVGAAEGRRPAGAGGVGAAGERPAGVGGRGLAGMRERVAAYGGAFEAGPAGGGGWRVAARLDLTATTARPGPGRSDPGRPDPAVGRGGRDPAAGVVA